MYNCFCVGNGIEPEKIGPFVESIFRYKNHHDFAKVDWVKQTLQDGLGQVWQIACLIRIHLALQGKDPSYVFVDKDEDTKLLHEHMAHHPDHFI